MNTKRLFAMILACVMLLSLAACGGPEPTTPPTTAPTTQPTTAPTTAPTTEPTTAPTEPEPDPALLYSQAVDSLKGNTNYILQIQSRKTLTVGGEQFQEMSRQTLTYTGYGTDAFRASLTEDLVNGNYAIKFVEYFQDGTIFTTVDDTNRFRGDMTAEEYTARLVPLVMLDASLYQKIEYSNDILSFSEPTAGEAWIVPEYAQLKEARGHATVDDNGMLGTASYDVTYTIGGNEIRYLIDVGIHVAEDITLDDVSDPDGYTKLDYADAPRIIETACGYLSQAYEGHSLTTTTAESALSQAGGILRNQVITINSWGTGADYTADVDTSIFLMTAAGEQQLEQVEHFADGVYTISTDGGEAQKNSAVKANNFKSYTLNALLGNIPDFSMLTNATAEDLGSLYYLELTFSDELPKSICSYICEMFYGDSNLLNDMASEYKTQTMDYYFAVDKYTGLPTAVGYTYEGTHTIDGYGYPLTQQVDQSFDLCSTGAYKELMDDVMTPTEPEEKATPLFYHVTGPNGEEMWLLGTIHVGDARTSYLPQKIYDAFDAADALAVEFDSEAFDKAMEEDEELSDQISGCYFYSDGTTTADHIKDEELYDYALKLLKATGSYNMNAPYAKAYLWSSSIDNYLLTQYRSLSSQQGVDNQLIWRAQDQEKPIYDVESGLFQTQMLTGFSDALQEQLLLESASTDPLESAKATQELFELWCSGDEAALSEYLNKEEDLSELTDEERALIKEYNDAMGPNRNDDMLDVAIGYLESGEVVFYAVGLAHLLAEDGLVHTLRAAGYTVELVTYD